jgi:hypothetical protein
MSERKAIPGFEGLYDADTEGNIWSYRTRGVALPLNVARKLKITQGNTGHPRVCLRKEGRNHVHSVAQLILLAVKGECPQGMNVVHRDGNVSNNMLSNLEYGSNADAIASVQKRKHCQRYWTVEHYVIDDLDYWKWTVWQSEEVPTDERVLYTESILPPDDQNTILAHAGMYPSEGGALDACCAWMDDEGIDFKLA